MPPRRHPRRRGVVILLVVVWWGLGLYGLDGSRVSSLQIVVVGLLALVVHWVTAAHRRREEFARARIATKAAAATPRTCVVLRRFGDDGDQTPSSRN